MRRNRLPLIKCQTRPAATDATLELGRFRGLSRQPQLLADSVPVELGTRAFDLLMVLIEAVSKPILPKTPVWKAVGFAAGFCQHLRQLADTSRRGVRCCSFWGDESGCGAPMSINGHQASV
jgi:hypothetical protein